MYYSNQSGKRLQTLLDAITRELFASTDILLTDGEGTVLFLTDGMAKDMGASPVALLGAKVSDLIANGVYTQSATLMALQSGTTKSTLVFNAQGHLAYGKSSLIRDEEDNIKFVLTQGTSVHSLVEMLDELLSTQSNIKELNDLRLRLKEQSQQLIFKSDLMYQIVKQAEQIVISDNNVLITGESGVGKDVFATYIHRKSNRSQKAFLPICIPAISPSLLEAELFGYVPGAFTNASKTGKQGLFEAANGGIVFLDEIGDIPLELQVKLLRVIETQEIFRVGSTTPIKLDIRIISATNKDLLDLVDHGLFRRDLYYRINTLSLEIPPLRNRIDDIRPLADFFLTQLNEKNMTNKRLADEAYQALENYSWPGNVRELRHMIEKMSVVINTDTWDGETVKQLLLPRAVSSVSQNARPVESIDNKNEIKNALDQVEKKERTRIANALLTCNGNKTEAAKLLNYSRARLYRKLKKWDVTE